MSHLQWIKMSTSVLNRFVPKSFLNERISFHSLSSICLSVPYPDEPFVTCICSAVWDKKIPKTCFDFAAYARRTFTFQRVSKYFFDHSQTIMNSSFISSLVINFDALHLQKDKVKSYLKYYSFTPSIAQIILRMLCKTQQKSCTAILTHTIG